MSSAYEDSSGLAFLKKDYEASLARISSHEKENQELKQEVSLLRAQVNTLNASTFILPFVPAEIINLILLRLPVKSLLRFRCVSKSWLSLISSIEFIKNHLSLSANNNDCTHHRLLLRFDPPVYGLKECSLSYLLYDSVTEAFDLDYPMKVLYKSVGIVGSVNGLICLAMGRSLVIWNPSIRKFKKLIDTLGILEFAIYFMYGFGYDELHDDFKVVIGYRNSAYHVKVNMYSVNNDSWEPLDDCEDRMPYIKSGVFVNGKIHWVSSDSRVHYSRNCWGITSVDLAEGKWEEVEQPCYGEGDFDATLGVLGSDLALFCNYERIHADVWVMKEYGVKKSWTKMFSINLLDDPRGYQYYPFFFMSNKGEILIEFGSTFMIYNSKDDSIRYTEVTNCDAFFDASIYIKSLVWPFLA